MSRGAANVDANLKPNLGIERMLEPNTTGECGAITVERKLELEPTPNRKPEAERNT